MIIYGDSLAATVAVSFCVQSKLNTLWLTGETDSQTNLSTLLSEFDSLAPEGVRFLKHIISEDELAGITLGNFSRIERNGETVEFDPLLGCGLHIRGADILSLLRARLHREKSLNRFKKISRFLTISSLSPKVFDSSPENISITCDEKQPLNPQKKTDEIIFKARWIIDGFGSQSVLARSELNWMSEPIWVSRKMTPGKVLETQKINSAEFSSDHQGWCWRAYDEQGNMCTTTWKVEYLHSEDAINCQWYRRAHMYEGRLLMASPTSFRFDPASGLGMTTQIKTGITAAKTVLEACRLENKKLSNKKSVASEVASLLRRFESESEKTFEEIFNGLAPMYENYGVQLTKAY